MSDVSGGTAHLTPPPPVLHIVERLERAGHQAWCVGGAVRDALMGHAHLDWDIATSARPDQVRRIFRRTIPVGIEFGTVGVLDDENVMHEVTTFRRDVRTDGRHAEVEFGVSLDDDLSRRDYTINAIAFSPTTREIRDPFDGQGDMRRRLVRAVGDADARMREDRLRALRGIRFAARFGFELEPATWRAITNSAPHLSRLSAERVKQEIEKTLDQVARPSTALLRWKESGAFAALVPALADAPPERFSATDALAQPNVVSRRPARRMLRVASLFLGLPTAEVRETLRGLRFSNADVNAVTRICDGWLAVGAEMGVALRSRVATDAQIRRWVAALGRTQWTLLMRVAAAVWTADRARAAPAPLGVAVCSVYRRGVRIAFRDPLELADLAIDGDDLRAAGVPNGPATGRWLARLLDVVVDDPAKNQRDVLLAIVAGELG